MSRKVFYFESSKIARQKKGLIAIRKQSKFSVKFPKIRKENLRNLNTRLHSYQNAVASFVKRHRTVKLLHLFRHYSSYAVVVSSALLVAATNVASGSDSGNLLFGYWDG